MKTTRINNMNFETLEQIVDFICRYNFHKQDCRVVVLSSKYQDSDTLFSTYTIRLKKYHTDQKLAYNHLLKDIRQSKEKINQLFEWKHKFFLNINTKYTIEV